MTSGRGDGDGGVGRDQHVVLASADSRGFVSLRQPATPRPERYALGRSLRKRVPRSALGDWSVPDNRADPVQQIIATHQGRLDRLIPIRIGRMIASPYAFLRGAAAIMAEDFAHLPSTGITPVICGDAHLGNFGFYAFPDTDGLTVCRALRATGSTVDVIAVTAQRKQTALNTAISLGVMAYLLKPFGFAQMRDTLERYAQYRYAQYPQGLGRSDEIRTQADVNDTLRRRGCIGPVTPPVGLSPEMLREVTDALIAAPNGLSATEAATAAGVCRVTARKYLEHLADTTLAQRKQHYGGVGRPEVRYYPAPFPT